MSCQNRFTSNCSKSSKDCNNEIEKTCKTFKPYPPRMTDEQFANKKTEALKNIPEELKGAISYLAYEKGHSGGNEEIYCELTDIVSAIEEPIKKFEARIRQEVADKIKDSLEMPLKKLG